MSNSFYNAGTFPATGAPATSASMRSELALIAAGFDKLPTLSGNGNKLLSINAGGTAVEALTPPSGSLVGTTATQTLTNKTLNLVSNTLTGTLAQFNAALSDADFASLSGAETLTNKTISGASNTLSNIGNASLTNSSLTIGSTSVSLGGTATTLAGLTSVTSTTFVGSLVGSLTGAASLNVLKAGDTMTGNLTVNTGADSRVLLQSSGTTQGQFQTTASQVRLASNNTLPLLLSTNGVDRLTFDDVGNVTFGAAGASGVFKVQGNNTGDLVVFESTDAAATAAPDVVLFRNSASPAAADQVGNLVFRGKDSGNADQNYARILSTILDPTAGAETGDLRFGVQTTSGFNDLMTLSPTGLSITGGLTLPSGNAQTTPAAVTFSATAMTVNCTLSNVFTTTFTANVTTAPTISSPQNGQTINWFITQDATGSRTMTWPSSFRWPTGSITTLSTAANSVDLLTATYLSSTGFWYASLLKQFV